MDKLRAYLNSLSAAEQAQFCAACRTSVGYLRKAMSARQALGAALCVAIERESSREVTRVDLRPEDWSELWPELAHVPRGRLGECA
nr:YdaS family helix-turn-helix protein [Pandoraea pnomenusa]